MSSEIATNGSAVVNGSDGSPNHEWQRMQRISLTAGFAGVGIFAVLGLTMSAATTGGMRQFFTSYLVGWVFWLGLPIGCMGLLGIHYITGSSWGVLLRRMLEAATRTLPLISSISKPVTWPTRTPDFRTGVPGTIPGASGKISA